MDCGFEEARTSFGEQLARRAIAKAIIGSHHFLVRPSGQLSDTSFMPSTMAEAALHSVLVNVARMGHGDKSMEWNAQNVGTLRAAELRGRLGLPGRGSARRVSF